MPSNIFTLALFGVTVSSLSFQLNRFLFRKGLLTERVVTLIARTCGIIMLSFGAVMAVAAYMAERVIAEVSALLYMLAGLLLIFAKLQLNKQPCRAQRYRTK